MFERKSPTLYQFQIADSYYAARFAYNDNLREYRLYLDVDPVPATEYIKVFNVLTAVVLDFVESPYVKRRGFTVRYVAVDEERNFDERKNKFFTLIADKVLARLSYPAAARDTATDAMCYAS